MPKLIFTFVNAEVETFTTWAAKVSKLQSRLTTGNIGLTQLSAILVVCSPLLIWFQCAIVRKLRSVDNTLFRWELAPCAANTQLGCVNFDASCDSVFYVPTTLRWPDWTKSIRFGRQAVTAFDSDCPCCLALFLCRSAADQAFPLELLIFRDGLEKNVCALQIGTVGSITE